MNTRSASLRLHPFFTAADPPPRGGKRGLHLHQRRARRHPRRDRGAPRARPSPRGLPRAHRRYGAPRPHWLRPRTDVLLPSAPGEENENTKPFVLC